MPWEEQPIVNQREEFVLRALEPGANIAALVLKITRCEYDRATLGASPGASTATSIPTSTLATTGDYKKVNIS